MKAYIIKIEFDESNPLIWRRVIMPAGATFNRLHNVIQTVTNFQSGYPNEAIHLYEFDLSKENRIVTNSEEAYDEHQHFVKNKKFYEKRLQTIPAELLEFEEIYQERLKLEVRKPTRLKIDEYLEKHKEISYNYDFGNDWWLTVKLEEIVDDYYFGYPTLLDGAETAPPEDAGGIHSFYEFLKVYRDPSHPMHADMKAWAEEVLFREYDPEWINSLLKFISYKKTEWDKINHENHNIISDKYRK